MEITKKNCVDRIFRSTPKNLVFGHWLTYVAWCTSHCLLCLLYKALFRRVVVTVILVHVSLT